VRPTLVEDAEGPWIVLPDGSRLRPPVGLDRRP